MASSKTHLVGSTNHKCYHKCLSGRGNLLSIVKAFVLLSSCRFYIFDMAMFSHSFNSICDA